MGFSVSQLRNDSPEEYAVLSFIINKKAQQLIQNLPRYAEMGLERVIELIEKWLEDGRAQIFIDDSIDGVNLVLEGEEEYERQL